MVLSVLVAMSLSPALCATLLKPVHAGEHAAPGGPFGRTLGRDFGGFNRWFDRMTERYVDRVRWLSARGVRSFVVYLLVIAGMVLLYRALPTSFLPDEDQGILQAQIKLPPGATAERAQKVLREVEAYFAQQPDVLTFGSVSGNDGDQASARAFLRSEEHTSELQSH